MANYADTLPTSAQLELFSAPIVGLRPIPLPDANCLLIEWGHRLGAVNRPYHQEAYGLWLHDKPISVATSGTTCSATVATYRRTEVVELTRLCSAPGYAWATRIMIRLWREVCVSLWQCWPVMAAVSYSQNAVHKGSVYRTDGWEPVSENCGSSGGGTWSTKRNASDAVSGSKSLWIWRYE